MSRFLTTRYDTFCLRSERRISAISLTLRPRYSETMSVALEESSSFSAATVSRLASVGMGYLPGLARNRRATGAPIRPAAGSTLRRSTCVRRVAPPVLGRLVLPRRARRRPRGDPGPVRRFKPRPCHRLGGAARGRRLSWAIRRIRLSGDAPVGKPTDRRRVWCRWPVARPRMLAGGLGDRRREDARDVDPDARAHRAGDRQRLEVLALRAGRLGPVDRRRRARRGCRRAGRPRSCPCRRRHG